MLEKSVVDFLNGKIDMQAFQQICDDTYSKCIFMKDCQYNFDAIKCLPFIHSFAFPEPGTGFDEYKKEVQFYLELLHHKVEYRYACVILLPRLSGDSHIDIDNGFIVEKIAYLFQQKNESLDNVYGILYDMLQKLISRYLNPQDDFFDYLNCEDELSKEYLKERIRQLYMYYTGEKEFILQLFCDTSGKDVFCIV